MLHDDFYFEPYDDILVASEAGCDHLYDDAQDVNVMHLQRAIAATNASAEEVRQYLKR